MKEEKTLDNSSKQKLILPKEQIPLVGTPIEQVIQSDFLGPLQLAHVMWQVLIHN